MSVSSEPQHVRTPVPVHFPESEEVPETKLHLKLRTMLFELLRFDPEAETGALRIWDNVDDDLVERAIAAPATKSQALPAYWTLAQDPKLGIVLRLSRDEQGRDLYPTKAEAVQMRDQRIRELEAELVRRGS